MNQSYKTHGNSGGQVVNVIIILFVIAVVAAVMYPVLTPRREGTPVSPCQRNLKECAIALNTYWMDYGNTLPSSAIVNHSKEWNARDFHRFARGTCARPSPVRPRSWAQVLYNYMKNKDIECYKDHELGKRPRGPSSYYWKAAIDKAWYGVGCSRPCRKEDDFGYMADQVVLYERAGYHEGYEADRRQTDPRGLRDGLMINMAFLDTHVRCGYLVNSSKKLVTDPAAPGEPRYFNYDNEAPEGEAELPPGIQATYVDPNRYSDKLP